MTQLERQRRNVLIAAERRAGTKLHYIAAHFQLSEGSVSQICQRLRAVPVRPTFPCGHPLVSSNMVWNRFFRCLTCKRESGRSYYHRRKARA